MPSLILSSRYTTDSQVLRIAAQQLGWETLRLDGNACDPAAVLETLVAACV